MNRQRSDELLAPVLAAFTAAWPAQDMHAIHNAYQVALRCHHGQLRKSGAPYITHPVEVSKIVARLGARREVVCAALLHDIDYPTNRLHDQFGPRVAAIVTGLRRLETRDDTAIADHDVLLLKLADRLHNMRTITYLAPSKQRRKSEQTLRTLVPLATNLGVDSVGRELSDLASNVLRQASPVVPRLSATRALGLAAILLPRALRARWLAEWAGELAILPTRMARTRFVVHLVMSMPRLARTLRHPNSANVEGAGGTLTRTVGQAIAASAGIAMAVNVSMTWATAIVALGALTLATALLFARTDEPARRLRELIDAWRGPRPR